MWKAKVRNKLNKKYFDKIPMNYCCTIDSRTVQPLFSVFRIFCFLFSPVRSLNRFDVKYKRFNTGRSYKIYLLFLIVCHDKSIIKIMVKNIMPNAKRLPLIFCKVIGPFFRLLLLWVLPYWIRDVHLACR